MAREAGTAERSPEVPRWVWLWLVPAVLAVQVAAWWLDGGRGLYLRVFEGELGLVELATAGLLVPAVALALRAARQALRLELRVCAALFALLAAGSFLLLGEEISWGQHLVGWESPEYFQEHNRQQETNLHSLEGVNKNLPKWVLVGGMGAGGIVALGALLSGLAYRPRWWWVWLLPTRVCAPAAAVVLPLHVFTKVLGWNDIDTSQDWGIELRETTELYIAAFLLLYAWSASLRLAAHARRPEPERVIGP